MKKIRVAMVRCDCHAYTFGPLLDKCDLNLYREYCHAEYFYMIRSDIPDRIRSGVVPGFSLTKVWDRDPAELRKLAHLFYDKPQVCETLEELTEDVDAAFINDCGGNGSDHVELTEPFLKKGIPTFLDKPFANTLKNANKLVALARKYKTPLFSSSILSYVNQAAHFKRRYQEELYGPIQVGVIKGIGGLANGKENLGAIIHGVSLALAAFDDDIDWVQAMGTHPLEYLLLHYRSGLEVMVINSATKWSHQFHCEVFAHSASGPPPRPHHAQAVPMGDLEFIDGAQNILRLFATMVRTRKPVVPYEKLIKPIAVVEAGRKSQRTGKPVHLKDLR